MFDLLLTDGMFPFTLALALLFGLLGLEVVFGLLGGTLLGAGADGPDLDAPDVDLPDLGDMDLGLDGSDIDLTDLELADLDADAPGADPVPPDGAPGGLGTLAAWLGFGRMPALIWLAAVCLSFGLSGLILQNLVNGLFGILLPAWLAALPCAALSVGFARQFGALFARLLPKMETEALSERHLGRRTGIVTQGTAARGRPAEVRVTDRFGNFHYLRAEPLRDDVLIPQGTEVMVLRHRHERGYLLVALT
ncbi:OB-fold-containig protein [Maliponia aquimaris]|uniref:Inner membrane protein YqiJ n=1 Tax=Maliponia aquimaris TaxID=1673631 RepID=A0A238JNH0_9RHOB|nr:OB-fold-containig protein [Maliponia aquimaris]SMX31983.1 Inner membrane protein YqiJ [Maliponia aquimaris]